MRCKLLLIVPVAFLACKNDHSLGVLDRSDAGGTGGVDAGTGVMPLVFPTCPNRSGGPAGVGPLPTPAQAAYQRTELIALLYFGLTTFDGTEFGDPAKDTAALFNPTDLDASQWVREIKNAGFGQVSLVVKHTTGFCLWPSAYTDYSVKGSPWLNGQGDLVKAFTDAAHAAGMRVGFYVSPLDDHHPSSSSDYEAYFINQLTELVRSYGPVYQIVFSGYLAPTSVNWSRIIQTAHQLQPGILVWLGPEIATTGADIRWLGNSTGLATRSTSSIGDVPNGGPTNIWYPAEGAMSIRGQDLFWHPNSSVIGLSDYQSTYLASVGMNTTLSVSVAPATTGQLDTPDVDLLRQFGSWYASLYKINLVQGQLASADTTWASPGFDAAKAVDGDVCTYWAAASGKTSGRLEVTPASAVTFKVISIREPIELGERATAYHVEIKQNGSWNKTPTDVSGATIAGTVIGQRQLWQVNSTTADAIALVIDSAKAVPAIAEFSVY